MCMAAGEPGHKAKVLSIRGAPSPPKLLDRVRQAIRMRHYSRRTESAYVHWIRRFIIFHGKKHPDHMGASEVTSFLSWLATSQRVSASTQNQALSAILFLYKHVLQKDLGRLEPVARAKTPHRVPVVLSRDEVSRILHHLTGRMGVIVGLLYGPGCGCRNVWSCVSRTSTSTCGRSSSAAARGRRIDGRCCHRPWRGRCGPTCRR